MTHIFSQSDLSDMAAGALPRDQFGPGSPHPFIAFRYSGEASPGLARWLSDLPCPVISIGDGPAADASDVHLKDETKLARIAQNIETAPITAMILVQHLRASESQSLTNALTAESLAYAALQTGPAFQRWKDGYEGAGQLSAPDDCLLIDIDDGQLDLQFNDPDNHNAIGVKMRDALCEILDMALINGDINHMTLAGIGRTFSTGGAIEEFGEVSDPATAHWVRSLRLPAWRLARFSGIFEAHVNGPAIGAGIEIAAFAQHITAEKTAWFQLPELKYGLIPGAGGTASIARRIGRQKTAYMALSMEKIRAETALTWGLIDKVT